MLIVGEEAGDRLELSLEFHPDSGDYEAQVTIQFEGFAGKTETFIGQSDWTRFLSELEALVETRTGRAQLKGLFPNELHLDVVVLGRQGHVAIEGFVGRSGPFSTCKLSFSPMRLKPTSLVAILGEAKQETPPLQFTSFEP